MSFIAVGGIAAIGIGAGLGASAGNMKKKELSALGDYPGLDTSKITDEALRDLEKYLPRDIALAEQATQANQGILNRLAEENIPRFKERKQTQADLIDSFLRGELPDDVAQAVERRSAATGLGLGISGSGLGRNLTARDLGRTSLDLIGTGFGMIPQFQSSIPMTNPVNALSFAGPMPNDLVNLRGQERQQRLNIGLQRAGVQGATGAWGNFFSNIGGIALGAGLGGGGMGGMMGGMGGGSSNTMPQGWSLPDSGSLGVPNRFNFPGTQYGGGWR
jgi:hypothetical protein